MNGRRPAMTTRRLTDAGAPSTLDLPPGSWATVLDALCAHFAAIPRETWLDRFERGRVTGRDGTPLSPDHPYREGLRVHYVREVEDEPVIPFEATILHVDDHLVVADKPAFLPVVPSGRFVTQTLLRRLVEALGNPDLVPLHRIDRETSGLVLFSADPRSRSRYQALFRERAIAKRYDALAPALPGLAFPHVLRSRIGPGEPFFRMREVDGEPNSETRIDVLARGDTHWHYALEPVTGRKHQLRVHMAALGAPILGDTLYPDLAPRADGDFSHPLRLLASGLAFDDPLDGRPRRFESRLAL